MLDLAFAITSKDIRLSLRSHASILQAILLGLLLIFLFSLTREAGQIISPFESATIFWISTTFCQILIFNQLFSFEEESGANLFLALTPAPVQEIWLGKLLAAFALLLIIQAFLLPACIIFLAQSLGPDFISGLIATLLCDFGLCSLGALMGAVCQGQSGRDILLAILLFPLLTPILLAGINLGAVVFDGSMDNPRLWLGVSLGFDALYSACALIVFGFVYKEAS